MAGGKGGFDAFWTKLHGPRIDRLASDYDKQIPKWMQGGIAKRAGLPLVRLNEMSKSDLQKLKATAQEMAALADAADQLLNSAIKAKG